MTFQSRLLKLEKGLGETSRSPVVWVTIDGEKLIHVRLQNGTILTGSEAQQALEEARKKRDPFKVFSGFDPHNVFEQPVNANRGVQ
jgi:predicted lipoprotein